MTEPRHREERSDAAIHASVQSWIATACGLAMTEPRHREERSDAAIHASVQSWIATACGLAMTDLDSYRPSLTPRKRAESLTRRTMIQFLVFVLPAVIPRFARPHAPCCAHRPEREKP